jgi:hypothetical protein
VWEAEEDVEDERRRAAEEERSARAERSSRRAGAAIAALCSIAATATRFNLAPPFCLVIQRSVDRNGEKSRETRGKFREKQSK